MTQNLNRGRPRIGEVPAPAAGPGLVVIANQASVISAGTEKAVLELARKSLIGKAIERPDLVRRVLQKVRQEGLISAFNQARSKLDEDVPLGYSSAGLVVAVGKGVQGFRPGDRVASNGPHAGVVAVPRQLCALVPENVPIDHAALAVLGTVALNGVRLAHLGLGDSALVVGLGLVGQLCAILLRAQGTRVLGTDPDPWKCAVAKDLGADAARPGMTPEEVQEATRGLGADAVLVAAAAADSAPIRLAADAVRQKGRIVAVGAVGLDLPRRPLYFKEAELVVSCSYGPGRYDPDYEERGRDYPAAHVRWTEQRNLQAFLDLLGSGRLNVAPLLTHRFPIEKAGDAYALIEGGAGKSLGVLLEYPDSGGGAVPVRVQRRASAAAGAIGIGVLGAGQFARAVILPALQRRGEFRPRVVCAASGVSAVHAADRHGFEVATTDESQVLSDPDVHVVFVLTRHDQHARQVVEALRAGKHVFCEKPLALSLEELEQVETAMLASRGLLMVGFNRRFSSAACAVRNHFKDVVQPRTLMIRMNAGAVPAGHWVQDEETGGGRLVGEACHAIDLATFLAGSPPVRIYAEAVGGPAAPGVTEDQSFLTLRHADGSVSSIAYLAGGDRALGKERVEVLGAGRMAVIDDFREVTLAAGGKLRREKRWSQEKGHATEIESFAAAIAKGGPSPIPWEDLRAVSAAAILAVRSLREGVPFDIP